MMSAYKNLGVFMADEANSNADAILARKDGTVVSKDGRKEAQLGNMRVVQAVDSVIITSGDKGLFADNQGHVTNTHLMGALDRIGNVLAGNSDKLAGIGTKSCTIAKEAVAAVSKTLADGKLDAEDVKTLDQFVSGITQKALNTDTCTKR